MTIYKSQEELEATVKWLETMHKWAIGILLVAGTVYFVTRPPRMGR